MLAEQKDPLPMVLVTGVVGVGKSELALEYGYRQKEQIQGGIVFCQAANFKEEIRDFMQARFCETKDLRLLNGFTAQVKEGWRQWWEYNDRFSVRGLIIIDNVTDYQAEVAPYLPSAQGEKLPFRFVLTSQIQIGGIEKLELEELSSADASAMFLSFAEQDPQSLTEQEQILVTELCARLGSLPLALALAGSWLRVKDAGRTLQVLLEKLEQQGIHSDPFNEQDPHSRTQAAQRGVKATFDLAWESLAADRYGAQQLARVLGLFAAADIPWVAVERVVAAYSEDLLPEKPPRRSWWERLWAWIRGLFGQQKSLEISPTRPFMPIAELLEARRQLQQLSLVRAIEAGKSYRVHGLLHGFFGEQWSAETDELRWQMAFVEGLSELAGEVPKDVSWEAAEQLQPLRPHFRAAQSTAHQVQGAMTEMGNLNLAQAYRRQEYTLQGGDFRLNQVPIFARTFDQAKASQKEAKAALAQGNKDMARNLFSEAVAGYEKAITEGRKALPENSLVLAGYLIEIAMLFAQLGWYHKGIVAAREAVQIAKGRINQPKTLAYYLNELAFIHYYQGNYKKAGPLFQRSLSIKEKYLRGDSLSVARGLINLGSVYVAQSKYIEAEPLLKQSLSILEKQLGKDAPDVADSLINLANLYEKQGKYIAAATLIQRSLSIWEKQLEVDYFRVAAGLNQLGSVHLHLDDYAEAETLMRRSLSIREKQLGADHPDVAQSLNNLAALYRAQGKYAEAEPLFRRSLSIWEKQLGADHPDVASSLNNLAELYRAQGKYAEAEPLYRRSLSIDEKALGSDHPEVATDLNNLAWLYRDQEQYEQALPLFQRAYEIRAKVFGESHPKTEDVKLSIEIVTKKLSGQ